MRKGPCLLYNQDSGFVATRQLLPPISLDMFTYACVGRLIGTQVDAVAANMFNFGDATPYYPSDVPEARRVPMDKFCGMSGWREEQIYLWALENDPWPHVIRTAHDARMEFWAKMRFNDIHPRPWVSEFRRNHPEYELGDKCPSPHHAPGAFFVGERCRGYNFALPEVRAHRLALVEEVCSRYDVEGFEWDFMREPGHFFPDVEEGAAILTEYMREARALLDRIGSERGRAVGFGARVPAPFEKSFETGVRIDTWLREGLLDYVVGSAAFATVTNPFFSEFVELAKESGCRVYACTTEMLDGRWSAAGTLGTPPPGPVRAGALNAWRQGVDGINLNNFNRQIVANMTSDVVLLSQLGDPASLEFVDKQHILLAHYTRDFLPSCEYQTPLKIEPGERGTLRVFVGDDLERGREFGLVDKVTLELRVSGFPYNVVEYQLNGEPLPEIPDVAHAPSAPRKVGGVSLTWSLARGERLSQGENELAVNVTKRAPGYVPGFTVHELTVDIRYRIGPLQTEVPSEIWQSQGGMLFHG